MHSAVIHSLFRSVTSGFPSLSRVFTLLSLCAHYNGCLHALVIFRPLCFGERSNDLEPMCIKSLKTSLRLGHGPLAMAFMLYSRSPDCECKPVFRSVFATKDDVPPVSPLLSSPCIQTAWK